MGKDVVFLSRGKLGTREFVSFGVLIRRRMQTLRDTVSLTSTAKEYVEREGSYYESHTHHYCHKCAAFRVM